MLVRVEKKNFVYTLIVYVCKGRQIFDGTSHRIFIVLVKQKLKSRTRISGNTLSLKLTESNVQFKIYDF